MGTLHAAAAHAMRMTHKAPRVKDQKKLPSSRSTMIATNLPGAQHEPLVTAGLCQSITRRKDVLPHDP